MPVIPAIGSFIAANAATIVPAALGAGATLYGASQQRKAGSEALQAQQQATNQQLGVEQQMYQQQRADLEPWRQVGLGALQQLSQLYGIQVPQGTFAAAQGQQPMQAPTPMGGQNAYLAANPDVAREFAKPQVAAMFNGDPNAFAQYHYSTFGAAEGRQAPQAYEQQIAGQMGSQAMPGMETATARTMSISPEGEVSGVAMAPRQDQTLQMAPAQQAAGQPAPQPPAGQAMPANAPAGADPRFAGFFASPDYQYRLQQGSQNVLAQRAAMGGLESGAAMRELQNVGQQEASAEYANYFNRLSQLAGYGPSATSQIGAAGQNYAASYGQAQQNMAALRGQTSYANRYAGGQVVGEVAGGLSNILTSMGGSGGGTGTAREMFNPATAVRGYGGSTGQSFAKFQPPQQPAPVNLPRT